MLSSILFSFRILSISYLFGLFLFQMTLCVIAIILAKKDKPWLWYSVGAAYQFVSLIIEQYQFSTSGIGVMAVPLWIIYLVILGVTALLIKLRMRNLPRKEEEQKTE